MAIEKRKPNELDKKLLRALNKIDSPGSYCTEGEIPGIHPGLHVEGLGTVGLPLSPEQAEALKKRAIQAPFGKGTKTLVDTKVRRTWEIDASAVSFGNPAWTGVIDAAVGQVRKSLGLEKHKIEAHLYKLLVYEKGGFFLPHRDSEKLDRMVATLVVVLPSGHEGGELIVRHDGQEKRFDFGGEGSPFRTRFVAFYADCEHEVRPVEKGHRLCLVYNLTVSDGDSKAVVKVPGLRDSIEEISEILGQWTAQARKQAAHEVPFLSKAILLDHDYTEAGLSIDTLKGIDRVRAEVLFEAAKRTDCDAWLGLVTHMESGYGEYADGYHRGSRRRRYYDDYDDEDDDVDAEYEMIEVYETEIYASKLSDARGGTLPVDQLSLEPESIVSKNPIDSGKPSKQEFEGYTGNAGMTLDRWYHRAAIVMWPGCMKFDVLAGQGTEAAIAILESWIEAWHQRGGASEAERREFVAFASRIVATWGESKYRTNPDSKTMSRDSKFLTSLDRLGDSKLVVDWIEKVMARDPTAMPDSTLCRICTKHGWNVFESALVDALRKTNEVTIERNASILRDLVTWKDKSEQKRRVCDRLVAEIDEAFERWHATKLAKSHDPRSVASRNSILHDLIRSFKESSDPKPLAKLLERIRTDDGQDELTEVHVPVLLRLRPWLESLDSRPASLDGWIGETADRLMHVIASPPRYPTDWRRKANTACKCGDCKKLSEFLDDPNTKSLRLPLVEDRRRHLHQVIDSKRLDLTHVTERKGRPYKLVLTKTIASFQAELKKYETRLMEMETICEILACFRSAAETSKPRSKSGKGPKSRR